jgi:hypothetical protein
VPNTANATTDPHPVQWVRIDDFSPGCFDASNVSTEHPVISAPLGAANFDNTFACSSIKNGALAPLPGVIATYPFSTIGGLQGSSTAALIAGFIITPQMADGQYEIVSIDEQDDGTHHYVRAVSFLPAFFPVFNTITGPTETVASTPGFFGAPYPAFTRMTVSGSGNPPPVLVFPTAVLTDTNGASGNMWVYPSLSAPTTYATTNLIAPGGSTTGQLICYGNRVIGMAGLSYSWPSGGGIGTNENFNYTDPPESSGFGNQKSVLSIEAPWGYGAWGTQSVGELLLVKKYGGGVILNGDINTPTSAIRIPGLQPTGNFVGRAGQTPIGLIYCSQNRGAWLWNGGNTSQKISQNISDSFFDLETGNITSNNYGFFVESWQKWIMFSNNVILDTDSNAWWTLYPRKGVNLAPLVGRNIFWYTLTQNGNQMVCAPLICNAGTEAWATVFDNTFPSQTYQWQSLPIHVTPNADHVIDVRQVVVRASDPTNTGAATVQVTIGSFSATSTIAIPTTPVPIRFNVGNGAQGLNDIIVTMVAGNTQAAPIIHSIDIGYRVRARVAVND